MTFWVCGEDLPDSLKREAKRTFIHRFTGEHRPKWVDESHFKVPLHFRDDAEWLANTRFAVRRDGSGFDARVRHCESKPTFPDGTGA